MGRNDKTKLQQWTKQIKTWETSGLTQRAYCVRESLKYSTFDYWRRQISSIPVSARLTPVAKVAKQLNLVPVQVTTKNASGNMVVRSPSGWQLELPSAVEAAWLATLLRQLS